MTEIYGFSTETKHSAATDAKLGSYQASTAEIIARGQAVLSRLECNLSWSVEWRDLIQALGAGRDLALRTAGTDKPHGPKYRAAMGPWLRCYGFDRINEGDRSRLLKCYDNLTAINAWRSALPAEKQQELNHPRTVLTHWKRSLQPGPSGEENVVPASPTAITVDDVIAWLATATQEEKRRITAVLIKDTALFQKFLPKQRTVDRGEQHSHDFELGVRSAVATAEPPVHQVAHVKALIEALDGKSARTIDWRDRMAPSSHFPIKPGTPAVPPADSKTADANGLDIPPFLKREPAEPTKH